MGEVLGDPREHAPLQKFDDVGTKAVHGGGEAEGHEYKQCQHDNRLEDRTKGYRVDERLNGNGDDESEQPDDDRINNGDPESGPFGAKKRLQTLVGRKGAVGQRLEFFEGGRGQRHEPIDFSRRVGQAKRLHQSGHGDPLVAVGRGAETDEGFTGFGLENGDEFVVARAGGGPR